MRAQWNWKFYAVLADRMTLWVTMDLQIKLPASDKKQFLSNIWVNEKEIFADSPKFVKSENIFEADKNLWPDKNFYFVQCWTSFERAFELEPD